MLCLLALMILWGSSRPFRLNDPLRLNDPFQLNDSLMVGDQTGCNISLRRSRNGFFTVADCRGSNVFKIPRQVPENTEVLQLSGNQLYSIDETSFSSLTQLRDLDLGKNRISSINLAFHNLTSLRRLSLTENHLQVLNSSSFLGPSLLETLDLSFNLLSDLESGCFLAFTSLIELDLAGNKLGKIPQATFSNLTSLKVLNLERNHLEYLEKDTFHGISKLENLSLAYNRLRGFHSDAFAPLNLLKYLALMGNLLEMVPSASLEAIKNSLTWLSFDANPFRMIGSGDFQFLPSLVELDVSFMPGLRFVDSEAFSQLERLEILKLRNNSRLEFLDPRAISSCNSLRSLYLENNNLSTIVLDFGDHAPPIELLLIEGNPLTCDCRIRSGFPSRKARCRTVEKIEQVLPEQVLRPEECLPNVIPFFHGVTHRKLGDHVILDCRGVGDPSPRIFWIIPNNRLFNQTMHNGRILLDRHGSLTVTSLKPSDAGVYSCVTGNDSARTMLRIYNPDARVVPLATDYDSITVTWSGTNSTMRSADYVIVYRAAESVKRNASALGVVHLSPYMRKYTISALKPNTAYQFCMTYSGTVTDERARILGCALFSTRSDRVLDGIRHLPVVQVTLVAATVTTALLVICVGVKTFLRRRKRKAYQQPSGLDQYRKVGEVSQIPLDSLYHPPSTPIATSRTSLVGLNS